MKILSLYIKCYKAAIVHKLDITQFYHIMGNYSKNHLYILNQNSGPIQKPLIKTIFFIIIQQDIYGISL